MLFMSYVLILQIAHTYFEGSLISYDCHFQLTGQGRGPTLRHTQGVILAVVILMIFTEANQGLLK